jgi:hypothetical protein
MSVTIGRRRPPIEAVPAPRGLDVGVGDLLDGFTAATGLTVNPS